MARLQRLSGARPGKRISIIRGDGDRKLKSLWAINLSVWLVHVMSDLWLVQWLWERTIP